MFGKTRKTSEPTVSNFSGKPSVVFFLNQKLSSPLQLAPVSSKRKSIGNKFCAINLEKISLNKLYNKIILQLHLNNIILMNCGTILLKINRAEIIVFILQPTHFRKH